MDDDFFDRMFKLIFGLAVVIIIVAIIFFVIVTIGITKYLGLI